MRPNILIINSDQHRYDCISTNGNKIVKTPNLDYLANKGINFHNAFTPIPLCCPARQTFMCGVVPEVHGKLWNYNGSGHAMEGLDPSNHNIWVHQLKDAGYSTAYIGKWHVSNEYSPKDFGFDYVIKGNAYPPVRQQKFNAENPLEILKGMTTIKDEGEVDGARTHSFAKDCIKFINKFQKEKKPWHIRLDFPEPHLPCFPAGQFKTTYNPSDIPPWNNFFDNFENKPFIQKQQLFNWGIQDWSWKEWSQYVSQYYGMISQCDDAVGMVVNYLERNNLNDNTIIVYTSDHGDATGSHRMIDKHYILYDNVIRVPLIIRWDGHISPRQNNFDFISHYLDISVTLLDILGLKVPVNYQGHSCKPVLEGQKHLMPRKYVISSYNGQQFGLYTQRMIRDNNYKFIWNLTDISEFYDLCKDPAELHNMVDSQELQDTLNEYRRKLYNALKKQHDPLVDTIWMKEILNRPFTNPRKILLAINNKNFA